MNAIRAGRTCRRGHVPLVVCESIALRYCSSNQLVQTSRATRSGWVMSILAAGASATGIGAGTSVSGAIGTFMSPSCDATLDVVAQLPHVPGPAIMCELLDELRAQELGGRRCVGNAEIGDEVLDEQRKVGEPLAQGWKRDLHDGESIVEIGAKFLLFDLGAQTAIRGCDDPKIDGEIVIAAQSLASAVAPRRAGSWAASRESALPPRREKASHSRPPRTRADTRRYGAGERSPFAAEELPFEQRGGIAHTQSTTMNGPSRRALLARWIVDADASLPVPVSPSSKIVAFVD